MLKRISDGDTSQSKRKEVISWLKDLEEHGYAVIPSVIPLEKVQFYRNRFWDWMESFNSGIDRANQSTWKEEYWPISIRGLLQHYRIGHSKFVWDMRSEPNVIDIFSTLWGTDDLLVSFDGACLSYPGTRNTESWAHLDQGPKLAGKYCCVQGLVTLSNAGPGMGGLLVYDGSHKKHKEFFDAFPDTAASVGTSNWCKLEPRHWEWYKQQGCVEIQPSAPLGSVILWDSRTVHWAARPEPDKTHCRMAIYVCYVPRSFATKKDIEKKRKAFTERRMTSHWPAKPKLFAKNPRTYGRTEALKRFTDRPVLGKEEETALILKLAGF